MYNISSIGNVLSLGNILNQILSEGTIIVLRKIYQNKKYDIKVTT